MTTATPLHRAAALSSMLRCDSSGKPTTSHRGVRDPGRKYAPAAVVVPKEKDCARSAWRGCLDMHIAPSVFAEMTELNHANLSVRGRRKPLFHQVMQGLLGGAHGRLLRSLAPCRPAAKVLRPEHVPRGWLQRRLGNQFAIVNVFKNNDNVLFMNRSSERP